MKMSNDREWLRKRAEREDRHLVSVGGLASPLEEEHPNAELSEPTRTAVVSLLRLAHSESAAELVTKYLKVLSERQKP